MRNSENQEKIQEKMIQVPLSDSLSIEPPSSGVNQMGGTLPPTEPENVPNPHTTRSDARQPQRTQSGDDLLQVPLFPFDGLRSATRV
jgi:hypothetical protein